MKEYSFILSEKTYSIKDENDLELIFRLFSSSKISSMIHWNIIMEVDSDLEKIITTYKWLLKCIKYLNEKNAYLLMVKVSDILPNIIKKSTQLWELLAKIPWEENKLRLLSRLRNKWLTKILKTANDLWNIFEWFYWDKQKECIDLIWKDLIREIFLWTNEIVMILNYLNGDNKDYLIDIIWFDGIKNKVKTKENFLVMFNWLSIKKSKLLLKKFERKEIVNFFSWDEDFYRFMLKLSSEKEKIFLKYLWF